MLAVEADPAPARKKGLHYGFMIIAAGFLTQFVLLCCQRMPALTLENIRVALNISYTEVGLITSWFTVFYAGGAFLWGYLNDAIGAKKTLSLAAAVAAIGLVAFGAFAQNGLLVAVIVWSVAGLGCAGLYMATLPVLIANWFAPKRRGFAMGLITPGGNVCSIVLGLVVPTLVVSSSWQVGFIVVGVFCALVTVFIFAFVRTYPSEKGLAPYGSPAGTQAAPSPNVETLQEEKDARQKPEKDAGHKAGQKAVQKTARLSNFAHVLRSGITWHFGALYTIYQIGYMVSTTYYVASTIYAGYTPVEAGLGITFGGLATVVSLNVFGNLSDRIERKYVLAVSMAGSAIIAIIYFFVLQGTPALWTCWLLVALLTAFNGNQSAMLAASGDYYDTEHRGTGTGVISTLSIVGRYSGPVIAGMMIDSAAGAVSMAFLCIAITMAVSAVGFLTLPKLRGANRVVV